MNRIATWLLIALVTLVSPVLAHDGELAPDCPAPSRPDDKGNPAIWNPYVDALDAYRECINRFIEASHKAADLHRNAANGATRQWNDYVARNLNVPEDFPFQSDRAGNGR